MEVHDLHLKSQAKEKDRYIEYSLKLTCLFAKRTGVRSRDYQISLDALWNNRYNWPVMYSQFGKGHCFTKHLHRKNDSVVVQCNLWPPLHLCVSKINVDVTLNDKPATLYVPTVERRYSEGPRDWQNLFAIMSFFFFQRKLFVIPRTLL